MMMRKFVPVIFVLAVGTAHAAGLVAIGQDATGQAVVGDPSGVRPIAPQGAWDVPTFHQQPAANGPTQQTKPPAKPTAPSQPAP
jgi:hypothetical protein